MGGHLLEQALQKGHDDIADFLVENGAKIGEYKKSQLMALDRALLPCSDAARSADSRLILLARVVHAPSAGLSVVSIR
ncbi:MAG: hypothetical protein AAGG38_12360 [Planctomycetota bacterium]